ncbi:MAG TPA: demethoxyubiquinone hydroxylase family protein [Rhizomicrobium sp.]|nr:demethoxyubiquinone hydroxylase family protein [Rhizomicrobium sp.]
MDAGRRFRRTVKQILRVNHAGEYGAIRIYQAQILTARFLEPTLLPFLRETLAHEREHLAAFRELMPPRGTRPCGALPLWGTGGALLGLFTGLLGRDAIFICTEAVERTVHAHLERQLRWLGRDDPTLSQTIRAVQAQEEGHLRHAQAGQTTRTRAGAVLARFVAAVTALLIWCSTYGAPTRMKGNLNRAA